MKAFEKLIGIGVLGAFLTVLCAAQSAWDQIRQKTENVAKTANSSRGLSNDKIVAGLKEALTVSTRNAVASTGRMDGFLKNEAIRILLPDRLRHIGSGLRLIGMG